jgi:SIR2-like protein
MPGASTKDSPQLLDLLAYRLPSKLGRETREQRSRNLLLRSLEQGTTIAFLGAGVSAPFGYPEWKDLGLEVIERTFAALKTLKGDPPVRVLSSGRFPSDLQAALDKFKEDPRVRARATDCFKYINSLKMGAKALKKRNKLEADALMFMIGACKSALGFVQEDLVDSVYYELFREKFKKALFSKRTNAFGTLLKLPLQRFVTTNYDWEIEKALAKSREGVELEDFGLRAKIGSKKYQCRLSLTQRSEDLDRLALFVLARARGTDNMVYHCHGRFDDPKLIVATEADYQHWYLSREAGASAAFQQGLELLLGSNPLLFIGYSLRDDDLLRPLRQLGVLDPVRKDTRPLFALLECSQHGLEKDRDRLHYEVLFERYGLHVVHYARTSNDPTPQARAHDLREELKKLQKDLEKARRQWSAKPFLKHPVHLTKPPAPYREIDTEVVKLKDVPVKPFKSLAEEVGRPGVVVLVGPSGSGKSFHALKLTETGRRGFAGIFYWNAHYGNEAMTALDHALAYFDPGRKIKGSRHQRIRECLRENRFLLILDGCERLLRRTKDDDPRTGITYSVTFRRLLEAFADPRNKSTVVLASRLKPLDLDFLQHKTNGLSRIRYLSVSRVEVDDLKKSKPFKAMFASDDEQVHEEISALCSLLRGHSYGLFLAGRYLERAGGRVEDRLLALKNLNRSLADKHRDKRLQEMVNWQVRRADEMLRKAGNQDDKPASGLLERLTTFLGPVCEETLKICFKEACSGNDQDCDCTSKELEAAGLLFPMHPPVGEAGVTKTYTVHCTARSALLRSRHSGPTDPLPAFGLSGCTCGRLGVNPDRARKPQLRKLFDRILEAAEAHLDEKTARTKTEYGREQDRNQARALCRDAFSLVRTGMDANTAPRWCTYDEYVQFPLAVAILAKRVAREEALAVATLAKRAAWEEPELGCWTYCEHADAFTLAESEDASLYPAELAWLYHDIALALSGSGSIHDACTFLEQAYEVSRLIEHPAEGGGFHLEVLLSLAFTFIEMGRLPAAGRQLDDAERLAREVPDDDFTARILGLRGLMLHLKGDLQGADDLYDRCLKLLRPGMNLRAQSIFLKHKADVKISMQEFEEADLLVRNSRALAESGVFPELVANARISEGHRLTRTGQAVQARLEYTAVLHEAQRIGFRKLEVRALTALARLALDQKDADGGRDYAMRALTLANQLGLGLRQSHALVVLGLATLEMGQSELGIAYLRSGKRLADDQEYWSRSREAENKLLELGVDPTREN